MSARRFIRQAIPQAALLDHDLPNSGIGYKVLEAVAHYSNLGTCRASNATLAERAGCSERTVRRWLTLWIDKRRICDLTSRGRGRRSRSRQLLVVGMPPATEPSDAPRRKLRRARRPSSDCEVATRGHRTPMGSFPSEKTPIGAHAQSAASAGGAPAPAVRAPVTDDERLQSDLTEWREARAQRSEDERRRVTAGFRDLMASLVQAGRAAARPPSVACGEGGRAASGQPHAQRCSTRAAERADRGEPPPRGGADRRPCAPLASPSGEGRAMSIHKGDTGN
jgi:hypothetical protein